LSPNGDAIERRRRQARSWAGAGPISGWVAPTPAPTPTRWPRSRGRVFQPQIDPRPLSVESAPGSLTLSLADATGAAGALSGDPEAAPALISGAVGPASNDPVPRYYLLGATRAEVARVDWVRQSGTVSVQTIEHDAFPELRFFLIEDTERTAFPGPAFELPHLAAYAADGALLTDSEQIQARS
jgi:hypothetical protein